MMVSALVFATRAIGPVLMAGIEPSPRLRRFLDTLAVSVIAALVATALVDVGLREIAAACATVLVMVMMRSAVWAMIAGTILAAIWTNFMAERSCVANLRSALSIEVAIGR